MKSILSILWLLTAACALTGKAAAQVGWDLSGTWKIDPAKSKVVSSNVPAAGPDAPKAPPLMASVQASSPFPPLPSQFEGKELRLQFNFAYNSKRSGTP